jgi:SAM-dependent methyltransferase
MPVRCHIDTHTVDASAVADFGLQWREFDPYPELQALSYGHLFGRFQLPRSYFSGKAVVDLGCGNGRLGRFAIPQARAYVGVELSEALLAFTVPVGTAAKVDLVRASIEDLPLEDCTADVVLCWGVLHHVHDPLAAVREMKRIVKPGGTILLYIYPDSYAPRENLNRLFRHVDAAAFRDFCSWFFATARTWGQLDALLAKELCAALCVSMRMHTSWEVIQMFDGLGPAHHHLLENNIPAWFAPPWRLQVTQAGCFEITAPRA